MTSARVQRLLLVLALLTATAGNCSAPAADQPLKQYSRREVHMGVDFEVVLFAADEEQATKAINSAMARIAALDRALSDYDLESELSKLSATSAVAEGRVAVGDQVFPAVKLSDDLWTVLAFSQQISEQSGGAFDVTVGPLTKLWRRARRQKALPEAELFEPAKAAVGYQFLKLDREKRTAQMLKPNMRLDVGGIAKGYAADEALAAIKKQGLTRALVRASGDIAVGDPPPDETGWKIGIAPLNPDDPPTRFIRLANMAVSTSGDSRQHLEIGGKRYSHILDPRTGMGIAGRSSVTVIAPRGIAADGLDTAISVLGPDKGVALVAQHKGAVLFMVVEDADGKTHEFASPGFAQFEQAIPGK
jgi:thiamine biosynthesis lipoprotein